MHIVYINKYHFQLHNLQSISPLSSYSWHCHSSSIDFTLSWQMLLRWWWWLLSSYNEKQSVQTACLSTDRFGLFFFISLTLLIIHMDTDQIPSLGYEMKGMLMYVVIAGRWQIGDKDTDLLTPSFFLMLHHKKSQMYQDMTL